MKKHCPFCAAEIAGKASKRFCCDDHRNRFNSMMWLMKLREKATLATAKKVARRIKREEAKA